MTKAKPITALFAGLSVAGYMAFAWFGNRADLALPKSGGGDVAAFEHYSRLAGLSFWTVVLAWILTVLSAQFAPKPFRGRALFVLGLLMPIAFVVCYFAFLSS